MKQVQMLLLMFISASLLSCNYKKYTKPTKSELDSLRKVRIQERLDTSDVALVGNIQFGMTRSEYKVAIESLLRGTEYIRLADVRFYVNDFDTLFDDKGRLVMLGMMFPEEYLYMANHGLTTESSNAEHIYKYLSDKYGSEDTTHSVYRANNSPLLYESVWIFKQRVIVRRFEYEDKKYVGEHSEYGDLYKGGLNVYVQYYEPSYYKQKVKVEQEQLEAAHKEAEEQQKKETSYSSNL